MNPSCPVRGAGVSVRGIRVSSAWLSETAVDVDVAAEICLACVKMRSSRQRSGRWRKMSFRHLAFRTANTRFHFSSEMTTVKTMRLDRTVIGLLLLYSAWSGIDVFEWQNVFQDFCKYGVLCM